MADVTIEVRDNGPYRIRGGATIIDAAGNTFETQELVALCRCGHSSNKPFCDAAHKSNDFESCPRFIAHG
jgi:CDGSH-type Zn-finger protein